jgi:aspartyl-tRNA(Asn)/glutamyl-tRNA(Gln) amidotransferase subunit A
MGDSEVISMTAMEMLRRFRERSLSPVEAAEATLARIREADPKLNAYCLLDEDTTLDQARASEQRYVRGEAKGLLDGVPIAVKDILLTNGWPTLRGSKTIEPAGPWEHDAPVVAAMRRHGAVFMGKTTTPELGWKGVTDSPLTGISRNPWDPTKTCGGSSGGSAAALAAGMCTLAPGTDAGGSIRIPASFCGIVGFKPTYARVPLWPASVFAPLAHAGPMARNVRDAAMLMNVLAEYDYRDTTALPPDGADYMARLEEDVGEPRAAFSPDLGYAVVEPQVAERVEAAVRALEGLGVQVERADPGFISPLDDFETLFYGGAAKTWQGVPAEQRALMDPGLVRIAERASERSLVDYLAASQARVALAERMAGFHQTYDLLITPTMPILAFTAGRDTPEGWPNDDWPTWSPFTYPFNMTGQPAISLPCGFTSEGLPVGVQIVGAKYKDLLVLRVAYALEQALGVAGTPKAL